MCGAPAPVWLTCVPYALCRCAAGYYCPANSTSPSALPCGGVAVYCPEGSGLPVSAQPGEYTIGPSPGTRTGVMPCPGGSYCVGGVMSLCPAGWFGCADRLSDPGCNGVSWRWLCRALLACAMFAPPRDCRGKLSRCELCGWL